MNTLKYIEENKDRFLNELFELLRQPSISANPKYREDVLRTANIVKDNPEIGGAVYFEVAKSAVNNLATASGDISNLTQAFFFALTR